MEWCRVLCGCGADSDSHFADNGTIQMGWKEVAMRKAEVEYVCDRCGEVMPVNPHYQRNTHQMNEAGWRRVEIGSYRYSGSTGEVETSLSIVRDLCRLCYTDLIGFIEMDKPDYATVQ